MKRYRVYMVPYDRANWTNQYLRQVIIKAVSELDARRFILDNGWIAVKIEKEI